MDESRETPCPAGSEASSAPSASAMAASLNTQLALAPDDPQVLVAGVLALAEAYGLGDIATTLRSNPLTLRRRLTAPAGVRLTGLSAVLSAMGLRLHIEAK